MYVRKKKIFSGSHCTFLKICLQITLIGGSVNRVVGGVTFLVDEYFIHPSYDPIILDYDVAIMKIKGSFAGHANIQPVILANEGCQTDSGIVVTLAGW